MLFLPDADYETDPWGGSVAPDSEPGDVRHEDAPQSKRLLFAVSNPGCSGRAKGQASGEEARAVNWRVLPGRTTR